MHNLRKQNKTMENQGKLWKTEQNQRKPSKTKKAIENQLTICISEKYILKSSADALDRFWRPD